MKFKIFCIIFIAIFLGGSVFLNGQADTLKAEASAKEAEVTAYKKEADNKTREAKEFMAEIESLKTKKTELEKEIEEIKVLKRYLFEDIVYLTFDDGPSPTNCEKILDILKEYDVKATFFVVGTWLDPESPTYSEKSVELLKRISEEGHAIGIHAYNHDYKEIYKSVDAYFEDFDKVEKLIIDITGKKPDVVRFPSGSASAKTFCKKYSGSSETFPTIVEKLKERGYMIADWNLDTNDWRASTTSADIKDMAKRYAIDIHENHPKAAIIYLSHEKKLSIDVLPDVIKIFKSYGYDFLPMQNGGYTVVQASS